MSECINGPHEDGKVCILCSGIARGEFRKQVVRSVVRAKRKARVVPIAERAQRAALRYIMECSAGMSCAECGERRSDFVAGWMARHERPPK